MMMSRLLVAGKGAGSSITILEEVWRLKLYFQDAGKWESRRDYSRAEWRSLPTVSPPFP
jgi:hypothetical protein